MTRELAYRVTRASHRLQVALQGRDSFVHYYCEYFIVFQGSKLNFAGQTGFDREECSHRLNTPTKPMIMK
jgi:hypothetical protein